VYEKVAEVWPAGSAFTLAWKVEVKVPSAFWTTLIGEPPLRTPWPDRRRLLCGEEKVSVKVWPVTGSAGLTTPEETPEHGAPWDFVGVAVAVGVGVDRPERTSGRNALLGPCVAVAVEVGVGAFDAVALAVCVGDGVAVSVGPPVPGASE
jgi:hypothetical protein